MIVLFILLFIFASELTYSVATQPSLGYNPYPFGTPIICVMIHISILANCVFYLGWIVGIIVFVCHLFAIPHATVGWILTIPTLFFKKAEQYFKLFKIQLSLLVPLLVISIAFFVTSIFVSKYAYLSDNITHPVLTLIIVIAASTILWFTRSHMLRAFTKNGL